VGTGGSIPTATTKTTALRVDERRNVAGRHRALATFRSVPLTYHDTHDVDADQLKALLIEARFPSASFERERIARIIQSSWRVASAREGDTLVGFARAIGDGASLAYVANVVVREADRGKGIGSALIRQLLAGADDITFVLHAKAPVQPFYEKLGFTIAQDMLRRARVR
jgi:GNAT superfamily N-acetyltransferase